MNKPDISEVLAGALLENDQLRARVAELEAQVAEIPDLLLIAHMQGAEQAKDQIQALRAQIESLDCRLVGRVAELSGSHCPADNPCDRCVADRRIEELSHAYAVQGLAIEDLETRNKYMELRHSEMERGWNACRSLADSRRYALSDVIRERDRYRIALNRILCETPGTTDCDFLYEIAREALDWTK